jgi:glutamate-1-semialdehyde 2,1-aminomutase
VLIEPVIGDGYIPADPAFLRTLRDACDRLGIVLVFDELITFGLGPGGAQERLGVVPDLTALGKIIGGGLPIGAVGGRRDLMAFADPTAPGPTVSLGSTFAGHPLAVAAGLAQLDLLTPDVYAHLDRLGARFLDGVAAVRASTGTGIAATGMGNLVHLHWNPDEITDYETHRRCRHDLLGAVTEGLLTRGFAAGTLGRCHLSAAMTDDDIDALLAALAEVVSVCGAAPPPR